MAGTREAPSAVGDRFSKAMKTVASVPKPYAESSEAYGGKETPGVTMRNLLIIGVMIVAVLLWTWYNY